MKQTRQEAINDLIETNRMLRGEVRRLSKENRCLEDRLASYDWNGSGTIELPTVEAALEVIRRITSPEGKMRQ